jgi:cholesterol transport system auxiliary component
VSRRLRVWRLTALAAGLAAGGTLAGCGSLLQNKAPPTAVYLLSAPAATPGPAIAADLVVRRPRVRTGLDTDRIAALFPDRRLDFYADARWSGTVGEVVLDLALQSFRAGAGLRSVADTRSHVAGGYWLELEVVDFQAEYDGGGAPSVHVRLLAQLGDSAGHLLGRFEAAARDAAAQNRLGAIVDAYNRAAGAALAQLVADSQTLLATATAGRPGSEGR